MSAAGRRTALGRIAGFSLAATTATAATMASSRNAAAQSTPATTASGVTEGPRYPTRTVTVTVGLQVGTGSDVATRNVLQKVASALGQPFVVANLTGAAGLLAAQQGAKAAPDGHHLVALSGAALTTLPHMHRDYLDPMKDLVPIAIIVAFPSVISVNAKVPARSIQEFIALARQHPGKYTYASGGNGSVQHTAMERLKAMTGIDLLHVPYKGMAQATTDLVSGQVDTAIQGVVAVVPYVPTGQVRVLAWTGPRRNPLYPDIPTLDEAGVTGYAFQSWTALMGPAGLASAIVERLNAEVRKAVAAPDLRDNWTANGMEAMDLAPAEIAALIRREHAEIGELIRTTGIRLN